MDDSRQPILPQENSVINLSEKQHCGVISNNIFRVDTLLRAIEQHLGNRKQWLDEGFKCEMLAPGGIWQKGKIRLQLEFHPEPIGELFDNQREPEA